MANKPATTSTAVTAKEKKASNTLVIAGLISLVALVVAFVIGRSLVASIRLNAKVISKKTKARDTLQKNVTNGRQLVSEYKALGPRAEQIDRSLPTDPDLSGMANQLEVMLAVSGGKLRSVTPTFVSGDTQAGTTPMPFQFELVTEGGYKNLFDFLRNLEISSRPANVKSISVTGNNTTIRASLTLESYFQGPADLSIKMETVK